MPNEAEGKECRKSEARAGEVNPHIHRRALAAGREELVELIGGGIQDGQGQGGEDRTEGRGCDALSPTCYATPKRHPKQAVFEQVATLLHKDVPQPFVLRKLIARDGREHEDDGHPGEGRAPATNGVAHMAWRVSGNWAHRGDYTEKFGIVNADDGQAAGANVPLFETGWRPVTRKPDD